MGPRTPAQSVQAPIVIGATEAAVLEACRPVAVAMPRREPPAINPSDPVELPPEIDDSGFQPAERRLKALRALDQLRGQLMQDPGNPGLYYQVGYVHFRSLHNAAIGSEYFCRAFVLDPTNRRYRLAVLSTFMDPRLEMKLELLLRPADRNRPWRLALEEVRRLQGVSWLQRAQVFEDSIHAQTVIVRSRSMGRARVSGLEVQLEELTQRWLDDAPATDSEEETRYVASFSGREGNPVALLRDRSASADYAGVWAAPGPGSRWLVFGTEGEGLAPILSLLRDRLLGRRIGVSVRSGARQLYLVGVLRPDSFLVQYVGMVPESTWLRQMLQSD